MNGGWQTITEPSGQPFANQGLCIDYAIHHPVSLADLASSSYFFGTEGNAGANGCFTYQTYDATYPGNAAVGEVHLHVAGCVAPSLFTFSGSFTFTTALGTVSGTASGPVILIEGPDPFFQLGVQPTLTVVTGTGLFAGTTGSLLFSTTPNYETSPFEGSVTIP